MDTGTAAWTLPAATVSGVQNITVTNQNTGTSAGTNQVSKLTLNPNGIGAGQTLVIGDLTLTATGASFTAAQVLSVLTGGTVANLTLSGGASSSTRPTGYGVGVAGSEPNTVNFTATAVGSQTGLAVTGTSQVGIPQITVLRTAAGGTGLTAGETYSFSINGVTVRTAAISGASPAALLTSASTQIAATINAYLGSTVAVVGGTGDRDVTVTTNSVVNISNPTNSTGAAASLTTNTLSQAYVAPFTASIVTTTVGTGVTSGVDTLDADNFVNATTFASSQSTGAVTIVDLVQGQAVQMDKGSANLTATYKSTATSATLNVTGGNTAGTANISAASGTALTTVNVNSSGGAQTSTAGQVNTLTGLTLGSSVTTLNINATTSLTAGTISAAGLTSIVASGAATNVNLGVLPSLVTTVNGSGLTAGGITTTLTSAVTSFTGGAGVDTVTVNSTTAATAAINAGGGSGDILVLAAGHDISTSAKAAQYTNFEILRNTTTANIDMSIFGSGYTGVQSSGANGGFLNMTATQAGNVRILASNANPTYTLLDPNGTTDVLSLTLQNLLAANVATPIDVTGITANGFETLNIVSSAGTQNAATAGAIGNNVAFTAASSLTAINVSGAYDLEISGSNLAKAVTLTATNTGTFAASGNFFKGSTIQGNNTLNIFTVGGSASNGSTYNGGTGNDLFTAALADLAQNASFNTVLNGGTGRDTLTISDTTAGTVADSIFTRVSNMEILTFANTATNFVFASGGFFNAAYASGATVNATAIGNAVSTTDLSLYTQNATMNVTTGAVTNRTIVSGGSGTDVITVTAAAYTGANVGGTAPGITVSGGGGNDTIVITSAATAVTGAVSVNGGSGADQISVTSGTQANNNLVTYVIGAGDSLTTGFDVITGFRAAVTTNVLSDTLDFAGSATVAGDASGQAASGYTNVTFSIASGILTFGGTGAASLSFNDMVTIANQAAVNNLNTVAFTYGGSSYVFNQNTTDGDALVQLNLVTLTGLTTTATTTTAGVAVIA